MNNFRKSGAVLVLLILVIAGCGKGDGSLQDAPKIEKYSVEASNNGTEDSQLVTATITFNEAISVKQETAKELEISIGGERVKSSACTVSRDEKDQRSLLLKIHVNSITTGEMSIEPKESSGRVAGIRDEAGESAAALVKIHCLIPTGLTLQTVAAEPGDTQKGAMVTKEVTATWRVRSIAWIRVLDNGKPLSDPKGGEASRFKGALAVHGHDFLMADPESTAKDIVSVLKNSFGDRFVLTTQGNKFSLRSKTPQKGETLEVQVYETLEDNPDN